MILSIELSEEAWERLQIHREFADLTEQEFVEQFLLNLPKPEGDDFQNIVALANVMAHAIAQRKFNSFLVMMQEFWGTCDQLSDVAEELEQLVEG